MKRLLHRDIFKFLFYPMIFNIFNKYIDSINIINSLYGIQPNLSLFMTSVKILEVFLKFTIAL